MPDRDAWLWILVGLALFVLLLVALLVVLYFVLRSFLTREQRAIAGRLHALSWRRRFEVATALVRDERVPMGARVLPVVLVAYLALPLDLIPDFIPVIGQLDDMLLVGVLGWVALRMLPRGILDEHLRRAEGEQADETAIEASSRLR